MFYESFFILGLFFTSITRYFIEYCFHAWAGTPSCYLNMLDKLQKERVCRDVGPTLAAFLETLVYRQKEASLCFFYRYYLLIRLGGPLLICLGCMIFWSLFLHIIRMSMPTVSYLALLDSGILCFQNVFLWPMTWMALSLELVDTFNDLVLSNQLFCMLSLFLCTHCLAVVAQSYVELMPIKKNLTTYSRLQHSTVALAYFKSFVSENKNGKFFYNRKFSKNNIVVE